MLRTSHLLCALKPCNISIRINSIRRISQVYPYPSLRRPFHITIENQCRASCYRPLGSRSFHSTRPQKVPILPLPAVIMGILKSGKLVTLVSLSSKTSLTLLPHSFFRRYKFSTMIFASVPFLGVALLLIVGLDKVRKSLKLVSFQSNQVVHKRFLMTRLRTPIDCDLFI